MPQHSALILQVPLDKEKTPSVFREKEKIRWHEKGWESEWDLVPEEQPNVGNHGIVLTIRRDNDFQQKILHPPQKMLIHRVDR